MSTSDWERSTPTERGYPQASRAFEWGFIALVFWLQIGGYLDGWAHQHLSDIREDFFTPWHAVLYSGFTAVMVLLGTTLFRNLAAGRPVRRSLPAGYELSLIGGAVFAVGGALDLIWHGVFGIEVNLEALLSPTHLVLALGGFLIAGGPLRSAVVRAKSRENYLGNPETATVIDPAVIYYRPERLPMAVGVRNHIKARVYGIPMKMVTETKVWDEGHRMVIESVRPARPLKGKAIHLFEPHELGTRYTWSMEIIPTGPGGNLAAKLFRRFMQKNARKQQIRFKEILEAASE